MLPHSKYGNRFIAYVPVFLHLSLDIYYNVSFDFHTVILLYVCVRYPDILNIFFWITQEDLFSLLGLLHRVNGVAAECCNATSAFFILWTESAEVALTPSEFICDPCSLSKSFWLSRGREYNQGTPELLLIIIPVRSIPAWA